MFENLNQNDFLTLSKEVAREISSKAENDHARYLSKIKEPKIKIWRGGVSFSNVEGVACLRCVFGKKYYALHNLNCKVYSLL
jgi:hypothetical protein